MSFVMATKTPDLPVLTRAESEVMQALWDLGEGTVQQILEKLGKDLAYGEARIESYPMVPVGR